jgi:hypothetical protein
MYANPPLSKIRRGFPSNSFGKGDKTVLMDWPRSIPVMAVAFLHRILTSDFYFKTGIRISTILFNSRQSNRCF